jgi:hypothetical protein
MLLDNLEDLFMKGNDVGLIEPFKKKNLVVKRKAKESSPFSLFKVKSRGFEGSKEDKAGDGKHETLLRQAGVKFR